MNDGSRMLETTGGGAKEKGKGLEINVCSAWVSLNETFSAPPSPIPAERAQ
jgi:hypothetical protein